jgi:hypothetical protein
VAVLLAAARFALSLYFTSKPLVRAPPRFAEAVSVEAPEQRRDKKQDGLVERAGDRKETDYGKPAERARYSTVARK